MPLFDANMMIRTTGTLTQSESGGPVKVYGGQRKGYAIRAIIPQGYGANDTVLLRAYLSADGSTYNLAASHAKGAQKPGTAGLDLILPVPIPPGPWYIKSELVVTVASITPNFGTATVGVVENPGFGWDRSTDATMH